MDATQKPKPVRHHKEGVVRTALMCGNVALVGPAGSGKTTMARNVARDLGLDFYFTGAVLSEHKLTGFINAMGQVVRTPFRDAFEKGGLFLFDEVDASAPAAILTLNAALSNRQMDFPDACVDAHRDFKVIAASNTFWTGADRTYVGRNQLDGATLDRFIMIGVDYDETMERELAGHDEWVDFVQKVRKGIKELEIRHIVSPRAAIMGAELLRAGMPMDEVARLVVWKGLAEDAINRVLQHIDPEFAATQQKAREDERAEILSEMERIKQKLGEYPSEIKIQLGEPKDIDLRELFKRGYPPSPYPHDKGQMKPFSDRKRGG